MYSSKNRKGNLYLDDGNVAALVDPEPDEGILVFSAASK
jgi:hypothetical protein